MEALRNYHSNYNYCPYARASIGMEEVEVTCSGWSERRIQSQIWRALKPLFFVLILSCLKSRSPSQMQLLICLGVWSRQTQPWLWRSGHALLWITLRGRKQQVLGCAWTWVTLVCKAVVGHELLHVENRCRDGMNPHLICTSKPPPSV